jgi:hypothetical protein
MGTSGVATAHVGDSDVARVYASVVPRWKLLILGSVIIIVLSGGGAIIKARFFPAAHSVDLTPLGPIILGIFALLVLWIGAFAAWIVESLRKSPDGQEGSPRPVGRHS